MRPSRIVLLLVAIIAGGLAAYLATRGGQPVQVVEGPTEVIEEARTQILVATAPIGLGQRLSPETVAWADWPAGAVRPGYVTAEAMPDALDELSGAVARFEMFPGDPVLEAKLIRAEQGYLSAVLAKGMRGVSIAVNAESASGGFIVPNDRVDVVLTRESDDGQVSETILHNVRVLAINTRLGETGATGSPEDPETARAEVFEQAIATLELDPLQGETVINASKVGTLSLALRSITDFAESAPQTRRPNNQAVRMIRFGQESSAMAGRPARQLEAPTPVAIDPAALVPPAVAPEQEPVPVPVPIANEPAPVQQ
ncbi:MAG TPA: Flp pilus assembly protein CpaB [Devosiaceae bacterium]|jgi:pilus assembly protein CpaB|nr:Flp pilus assembly protein CpaB [Devosiaceae bacterium]